MHAALPMLVTTQELAAHLQDPDWIVFDCRHDLGDKAKGERLYREGHLPGAYFANVETDLSGEKTGKNGRHPLPSLTDFLAFLSRRGVTAASTIVAYDDAGGAYAARLWWLARWAGHERAGLLDGGIQRWAAEKRAFSTEIPVPRQVEPLQGRADNGHVVLVEDVVMHLGDARRLILDARAPERYRGEVEPIDPVGGHIPGAVNRFFKNNLNADLTFKSPDELKRDYEALLKSRPATSVVHQCGSGVTACVNLFAMEHAGLSGSKLFAGSWSEWVADPSRPVTVEPKKG